VRHDGPGCRSRSVELIFQPWSASSLLICFIIAETQFAELSMAGRWHAARGSRWANVETEWSGADTIETNGRAVWRDSERFGPVTAVDLHGVVAVAAFHQIPAVAWVPDHAVVARLAEHLIVARAAGQRVIAVAAEQQIITAFSI
jgi:hypothetical protein